MKTVLYKSKISLLYIGYGLIGFAFSGSIFYLLATASHNTQNGADFVIWALLSLFGLVSVSSLVMALLVKTIVLTSKELIVKRPFVFYTRRIELIKIKSFNQEGYQTKVAHDNHQYQTYSGKQSILNLVDGKTITFNSFEIGNYYTLCALLKNELRASKKRLNEQELAELDHSTEGYGWLIFLTLCTIGLIYGIRVQWRL